MACQYLRTSIFVDDIDYAIKWYGDIFDMTSQLDTTMVLPSSLLPNGKEGDVLRLVTLANNQRGHEPLALLQWMKQGSDTQGKPSPVVHLVQADDAALILERVRKTGSQIQSEYVQWDAQLPDGSVLQMGGCSFWDMNNHFFGYSNRRS
ncbi:VOC family protein [Sphingorhabdus sp. EL138]|uniref:VOC family protein n=1 Tax=Sphingorhabdus sp. EL138 TaxID=2073156 RepID=UPI000D69388F|nr:VOC family protein [Sphingorhabdus sp. EL138]